MHSHDDFPPVAVEGTGPSAAEPLVTPDSGHEPDPDWQPV